jgi:hypothetical protein
MVIGKKSMPTTLDNIPSEKLAELVIRSVYEDGGGNKVLGVSDIQIGKPPGGWSCAAVIDSDDGQLTLDVVYDGESYTDTVRGGGGDRTDTDLADPAELVLLAVKVVYEQSNWTVLGIRNLKIGDGGLTVEVAVENADTGDRVLVEGKYTASTGVYIDRLLQETKGDADWRMDAPAKGKGKGTRAAPKCNKGRPCGRSCIAQNRTCRQNTQGVVNQALNQAVASGGSGGRSSAPSTPPNPAQQISSILSNAATGPNGALRLSNTQVNALVAQSQQIYNDAKKLAPDSATFYQGIAAGNATPDDWIHKQINQLTGYDGKPQQVTKGAIDAAYNNGQYVAYRAMGSSPARFNQHFDNFKNGDFYAGHGIYGHGTYVAYAQQGAPWGRGVPHAAAVPYGSNGGLMRLALATDANVVDGRDHQYDVRAVDRALKTWYQSTGNREGYRRARAVLIGDNSGENISGHLATLMGKDAISLTGVAYDNTYMVLLNRSETLVQKTKGSLTRP